MNRYINESELPQSDLAAERRRADITLPGVDYMRENIRIGSWERITVSSNHGAKAIGRPMGKYDTLKIKRMDELTPEEVEDAKEEIAKELCLMCELGRIYPAKILVVGLGNEELTPDAVGAESAKEVEATRHLRNCDPKIFSAMECSEISVLIPGVAANSGIDTADAVEGIAKKISPDVIFAIDALASRSQDRLGTTVQISNTGVFPGTGLGHGRKPISKETTGVPVIAIGVPTIINTRLLGERPAKPTDEMFVSPKDIHLIVKNAAKIIGGGINQAFGF